MSKTKTKSSTAVVYKMVIYRGRKIKKLVGYLSRRDEEKGLDIQYDRKGYIVEAI